VGESLEGVTVIETPVELNEDGSLPILGDNYKGNNVSSIIKDKEGNVIGVRLISLDGGTRVFEGVLGQEVAKNILLNKEDRTKEENTFLENVNQVLDNSFGYNESLSETDFNKRKKELDKLDKKLNKDITSLQKKAE